MRIRRLRGRWREELPASAWRWLLLPVWLVFRPLVIIRNLLFDVGLRRGDEETIEYRERSPLVALRRFIAELRARTRATPLPAESEASAPFRIFADLASYEREVLGGERI